MPLASSCTEPRSGGVRYERRCWQCFRAIDLGLLFDTFVGMQNDVLLICHGSGIAGHLLDWTHALEDVDSGYWGTQNIQVLTLPGRMPDMIQLDEPHSCDHGPDQDYELLITWPCDISSWTEVLTEQLQDEDLGSDFTVYQLRQALRETHGDTRAASVSMNESSNTKSDNLKLSKLAPLGPLAESSYDHVHVLVVHWQSEQSTNEKRHCVHLMTDVLSNDYNYSVEACCVPANVPSHNFDQFFNNHVDRFLEEHDTPKIPYTTSDTVWS